MVKQIEILQANKTGNELEIFIQDRLKREGYCFVLNKRFSAAKILKQPIYTRQFEVGKSIYGTKWKCDFIILYHPERHPNCLVIESKWQQSGGSVDEKYPYLVLNIKEQGIYDTIIIIDGNGYKKEALKWLKAQVGSNLIEVFSMSEFTSWVNKKKI